MTTECNLQVPGLPWARFADAYALYTHKEFVERYERAVADYEANEIDDMDFWEELSALSFFEYSEIQWHIDNPGKRMPQGFA